MGLFTDGMVHEDQYYMVVEERDATREELVALKRHVAVMLTWLLERAELARQDGDVAYYGLRLAHSHLVWELNQQEPEGSSKG